MKGPDVGEPVPPDSIDILRNIERNQWIPNHFFFLVTFIFLYNNRNDGVEAMHRPGGNDFREFYETNEPNATLYGSAVNIWEGGDWRTLWILHN